MFLLVKSIFHSLFSIIVDSTKVDLQDLADVLKDVPLGTGFSNTLR
jgi:hypothetical protein